MIRILSFAFLLLAQASFGQHLLWYSSPARDWNQALPVGNGRMGAMVFGDPKNERIQLNEDSVWAGEAKDIKLAIGTPEDLAHVRRLIDDGALAEASRELPKRFSRGSVRRSYQTLGDLWIDWPSDLPEVADYRRELDLKRAIVTSLWQRGDTTYQQEVFCSYPDEALFVRLHASGPGSLDLGLRLDRPLDRGQVTHETRTIDASQLRMTGQVTQVGARLQGKPVTGMKGARFDVRLKVDQVGGDLSSTGNMIQVRGATEVILRLTASTDASPEERQRALHGMTEGDHPTSDFTASRQAHLTDHRQLYDRCELSLPTEDGKEALPTDARLKRLAEGESDPGLESLLFHYGRYLLIASSRDNGNPANLQGLWCTDIEAPWNSDYHLNINLQMNYWPADVTGLGETTAPLFRWMKVLAKNGEVTAREQYGMEGWMAHHATELAAQTVMRAEQPYWGSWIHGGGWMCQHLWEQYAYTEDQEFLRDTAYPLLAGHARFYLDWLIEKNGRLVSSFETSPENQFIDSEGKPASVCAGAAMGQQIIAELLGNTLAAAKVLEIEDALTREIEEALPKLDKGLTIGPDGRLLEWDRPYREHEPGHRHMSHLYAFHPGSAIHYERTPELMEAVERSIAVRSKHGSVGTGWSRAWAISIYARLRDGNTARDHLNRMLATQTLDNGFNSIFGRKRPRFQIEANLGTPAGIAEMLMQSHGDFIHLLPALPDAWPDGSVTGLRARGGYVIDLTWKKGELKDFKIIHPRKKSVRLKLMNEPVTTRSLQGI